MRGSGSRWLVFGVVAASLVAVLAWISVRSLQLERRSDELRAEYAQEGVLRLALARMDSLVTYLIAAESARPYYEYQSFYTEGHAHDRQLRPVLEGEVRVPSPLLDASSDFLERFFLLHFQLSPPGTLTSPQVPTGHEQEVALLEGFLTQERLEEASRRLEQLGSILAYDRLVRSLTDSNEPAPLSRSVVGPGVADGRPVPGMLPRDEDLERRNVALEQANDQLRSENRLAVGELAIEQGPFRGLLPKNPRSGVEELVLVRAVRAGEGLHVQGVWASWERIRAFLIEQVADLYPDQRLALVPVPSEEPEGPHYGRLASLPAALVVLDPSPPAASPASATMLTLGVAWSLLLAALLAVGVLLYGTLELSERRGRFVSAVTHELRTPLTTFCMYSEMLAEGVVRDEDAVREYHTTLRAEAERLRRIVDNVLLYARVEGGSAAPSRERLTAVELLDGVVPELERRAAESGLALTPDLDAVPAGAAVEVDPQAVEQILGNLVDNACKYAAAGDGPRVDLTASVEGDALRVVVRDHGPGVPAGREQTIFDAFRRATGDQSGRIPGIGLGLTLSRGMARQHRGDLVLLPADEDRPGAAFALTLPLVAAS